jgi:hypothetical protein
MLGIIGLATFIALWWQFSPKRSPPACWSREPDLPAFVSPPY